MGDSKNDAWEGDLFDREEDAEYLTTLLVNLYDEGRYKDQSFVLNLNAAWGLGKTYFLRNWAEDLKRHGHLVVIFDAWRNDFSDDALLSFISEIGESLMEQLDSEGDAINRVKKMRTVASRYAKSVTPLLASILAKRLTGKGIDELKKLIEENPDDEEIEDSDGELVGSVENTVSSLSKVIAAEAIKENKSKRNSLLEFELSAGNFIKNVQKMDRKRLPVFIFVDELDRCRPNFSVELLESIKHLFPINGFCFVVATDTKQLSNSIRALYGQDFGSTHYLRRFFDMEYQFPEPSNDSMAEHLFNESNIEKRLFTPSDFGDRASVSAFSLISRFFRFGPRDMQQSFSLLEVCCYSYNSKFKIEFVFLYYLICLKLTFPDRFESVYEDPRTIGKIEFWRNRVQEGELASDYNIRTRSSKSRGDGTSQTSVRGLSILEDYASFINSNLTDLSNNRQNHSRVKQEIINSLLQQRPSEFLSGDPYHSDLKDYPTLVRRAGNLSHPGEEER